MKKYSNDTPDDETKTEFLKKNGWVNRDDNWVRDPNSEESLSTDDAYDATQKEREYEGMKRFQD